MALAGLLSVTRARRIQQHSHPGSLAPELHHSHHSSTASPRSGATGERLLQGPPEAGMPACPPQVRSDRLLCFVCGLCPAVAGEWVFSREGIASACGQHSSGCKHAVHPKSGHAWRFSPGVPPVPPPLPSHVLRAGVLQTSRPRPDGFVLVCGEFRGSRSFKDGGIVGCAGWPSAAYVDQLSVQ